MNKPLISMESINKVFYSDDVETHALSNINLTIHEGEYLAITGPSGCGKSTLLSVLGLLDTASSGNYQLASQPSMNLSTKQRSHIRNKEIGFIFQSFNLISDMSVWENVLLPLSYRSDLKNNEKDALAKEALEQVGMSHRMNHYPAQLSGGQQQRVAVARAIAGKPSLLLADEPTGNLDTKNAKAVMELLSKLHNTGCTICIVTHDPNYAAATQRSVHMIDGQIVADEQNPRAAVNDFMADIEATA
ncbi:putative ABC transport system ATP-binding protein [Alteromonadaceae bacterium Bs31]|nr:putative ABC transport system ATP-binding protein [Alteromonadaceae bacterium Bs31]